MKRRASYKVHVCLCPPYRHPERWSIPDPESPKMSPLIVSEKRILTIGSIVRLPLLGTNALERTAEFIHNAVHKIIHGLEPSSCEYYDRSWCVPMRKNSLPQPRRSTALYNGAPPRLSSRNPPMADVPNNEQDAANNAIQREQDPNASDTTTDQSSALIQSASISRNISTTTNVITTEIRRRYLERQRSLDSLLTEALRISNEALTEMRRGSDQQVDASTTRLSRLSSRDYSSDHDGDE